MCRDCRFRDRAFGEILARAAARKPAHGTVAMVIGAAPSRASTTTHGRLP